MRNSLLSKKFEGPLFVALNIFRDPLLVFLKVETPPNLPHGHKLIHDADGRRTSETN